MLVYLQMIETDEDSSKFENLYREYRNLMFYLASKRLQNTEDAEDAVHQAFVRIAEKIQIIEPVCPKTRRLVVIMIENIVTDMLRERNRHITVEYAEEQYASPAADNDDNLLASCIQKLPEKQRAVIWLKYEYGYSLREIAAMLGISLVYAQKLDQRAKKKLEELYREGGGSL